MRSTTEFETVTAGLLIRRQVRGFLEQTKFRGLDIEWHESKGLIDSIFTIKGSAKHVALIREVLIDKFKGGEE